VSLRRVFLLGAVAVISVAALVAIVTVLNVRSLYPATAAAAAGAALTVSVMILREQGDGWQLFAVGVVVRERS
jgi:hypothetical protein